MSRALALTPGEPAGIGPDLAVQLAQHELPLPVVAFADPGLLSDRARQLGLKLQVREVGNEIPQTPAAAGEIFVRPIALNSACKAGRLDPANSPYVIATIKRATHGCIGTEFAGLVTGPVHKVVINDAAIPFSGHTELLAELTGGNLPVMMLACPGLRVALATTHLPLRAVPDVITADLLSHVLRVLDNELRKRFNLERPHILVCGLNPHAGEGGHLGREEIDVIAPTLKQLRLSGIDVLGPLPADTVFTPRYLDLADAVLAMYHDQGLPTLKFKGFGQAVNITLGLPIVRTSVDHGTAVDLAGTGQAKVDSLLAAIHQASELAASAVSG